MFGISRHTVDYKRGSYFAIFDEIGINKKLVEQIITDGLMIFNSIFGFKPRTFIAPNFVWNEVVEEAAKINGIISMQGASTQIFPTIGERKQGVSKNYIRKKSSAGVGYLVRCVFRRN